MLAMRSAMSPDPRGKPTRSGERVRPGRVLIVDDYGTLADADRRALAAEHEVVVASSALAVMERLREGSTFDVILCELELYATTGMELYEAVKLVASDQAARFVFMSRDVDRPAHCLFLARVPNVFLEAPIDLALVRALVEERVTRASDRTADGAPRALRARSR